MNAHETTGVLLKHDADVNAKNVDGAAREPSQGATYLTPWAPGPSRRGPYTRRYDAISTPLHGAALKDAHETTVELLRHGANVNAKDKDNATPLHYAADSNAHKTARRLLNSGADVNAKDKRDLSPLHYTVKDDTYEIAEILLRHGADVNVTDSKGYTPLHYAMGRKKTAELLLRYGVDTNAKSEEGYTALHLAVGEIAAHGISYRSGAWWMLRELRSYFGWKSDQKNNWGCTPLHIMVRCYSSTSNTEEEIKKIISELCDMGEDINAKNNKGDTPLHVAAEGNLYTVIRMLVDHGADINAKNNRGDTPLHVAVEGNRNFAVSHLVKAGADLKAKNNERKTPLHIARDKGYFSSYVRDLEP